MILLSSCVRLDLPLESHHHACLEDNNLNLEVAILRKCDDYERIYESSNHEDEWLVEAP